VLGPTQATAPATASTTAVAIANSAFGHEAGYSGRRALRPMPPMPSLAEPMPINNS
jgi:hypothetical protein